jgi:hypothetical protein
VLPHGHQLPSLHPVRRARPEGLAEPGSLGRMKMSRRRAISLVCCTVVTLGVLYVLVVGTPSEIQQHRKFVEDARIEYARPSSVGELFSSQAFGWLRQRGSTRSRRAQLGKEHEEALIRLGYFERRSYRYTNMNTAAFCQAVRGGPLHDRLCFFHFDRVEKGVVDILAHKDDFERIERLLQEYEKTR